ncbi:DsbA family protein [Lutibaculum baratangense]|uniref:DsbA family, Com1-like subfamily n=1 Tax=Lutibaculum baratangense AMV1 TaxID=631454 RepID=V4RW62_9HYPH|nr:DsbA family protein [Lutibaculum baratangense]ESR27260.1 DsbA family, Com1-like subfamily [Lutibaculum baratangense AMV1]
MIDRRQLLRLSAVGSGLLVLPSALAFAQTGLTVEAVLYDPEAPVLGNPDGDVTVVEYFDYQCPYCKKGHPGVMEAVRKDGNVRLVKKDWPIFGDVSVRAARLVLAAGASGRYEQALESLMATEGKLADAQVDATLQGAGFTVARLEEAYRAHAGRIDRLLARNGGQADAFGFRGTPSFVVQTTLYPGVMGEADLTEAIAAARS